MLVPRRPPPLLSPCAGHGFAGTAQTFTHRLHFFRFPQEVPLSRRAPPSRDVSWDLERGTGGGSSLDAARCPHEGSVPRAGTLCVPSAAWGHRALLLGHGSGGAPGYLKPRGGLKCPKRSWIHRGRGIAALGSCGDRFGTRLRRGEGRIQPQQCRGGAVGVWGLWGSKKIDEREPTQRGWSWGCVGASWLLAESGFGGAASGNAAPTQLEMHGADARRSLQAPREQQPRFLPTSPLGGPFPQGVLAGGCAGGGGCGTASAPTLR